MSKKIKSLDELRDSGLLYEKKLPSFGFMIILIVMFTMGGVVVWSMYAHKSYMIISQGTVTNTDSSYVMPAYTG